MFHNSEHRPAKPVSFHAVADDDCSDVFLGAGGEGGSLLTATGEVEGLFEADAAVAASDGESLVAGEVRTATSSSAERSRAHPLWGDAALRYLGEFVLPSVGGWNPRGEHFTGRKYSS